MSTTNKNSQEHYCRLFPRIRHAHSYAMQLFVMCLAVLSIAFLPGCPKAPDKQPVVEANKDTVALIDNKTGPQWLYQNQPPAKVALVFVHGIFGDTIGTWKHTNGNTFSGILRKDQKLEAAVDMFAFGYTSEMFKGGSLDVQEAANKLNEHLQYHKVNDYPAVVFIAHSMGGLVVMRHLLTRREQLAKVPVLILLGTPQEGAQIASLAKHVVKNDALLQMLPADRDGYLRNLNDEWRGIPMQSRPAIRCGYEKQETYGVLIVPWSSATRFCDGPAIAIPANHLSIVKPDGPAHDSIILVVNALNQLVIGRKLAATLDTPDFIRENDQLVFKLKSAYAKDNARLVNDGRQSLKFTVAEVSDPGLLVLPADTPRELAGNSTGNLQFLLSFGATESVYTFLLRSDIPTEQKITVTVPDMKRVAAQQVQLARELSRGLTAFVSDPARKRTWGTAASDSEVQEEVVQEARRIIAEKNPALPEVAQWVVATELLNSFNWHTLGQRALKKVEQISPASVKARGIQRLAEVTKVQSGKAIFESTAGASVTTPETSFSLANPLVVPAAFANSLTLAAEMQTIPALKPFGLSLKGDVQLAQGDREGAIRSIGEAAKMLPSPSLTMRIPFKASELSVKSDKFNAKSKSEFEMSMKAGLK